MIKIIVKVVGVTFENEKYGIKRQDIIKHLYGKEKIYLKREPKNRFDKNAVAVCLRMNEEKDIKLGYVRSELAAMMAELWDEIKFVASIQEIRDGDEKSGKSWGLSIRVRQFSRRTLKKKGR